MRAFFHSEVFELSYHGGFNYSSVYNMPIFLRRFYIKKINEYLKEKQDQENKQSKSPKIPNITNQMNRYRRSAKK